MNHGRQPEVEVKVGRRGLNAFITEINTILTLERKSQKEIKITYRVYNFIGGKEIVIKGSV